MEGDKTGKQGSSSNFARKPISKSSTDSLRSESFYCKKFLRSKHMQMSVDKSSQHHICIYIINKDNIIITKNIMIIAKLGAL